MPTKFEFSSTLHSTSNDMLGAIAANFLTAYGMNNWSEVTRFLVEDGADNLARECIEEWGLDQPTIEHYDGEGNPQPVSHMAFNGYTAEELADAIRDFAATRPDISEDDLTENEMADLDASLRDDLDGSEEEFTAWTADCLNATVSNQCFHIVHHAEARRGGIVMVGSGSSGATAWTEAPDPAEVLRRTIIDGMRA